LAHAAADESVGTGVKTINADVEATFRQPRSSSRTSTWTGLDEM